MVLSRRLQRLRLLVSRRGEVADVASSSWDEHDADVTRGEIPVSNGTYGSADGPRDPSSSIIASGHKIKHAKGYSRRRTSRKRRGEGPDSHTSDRHGNTFDTLDINRNIVEWLKRKSITVMTRVQKLAIPKFVKSGNDVLVQSHTGSGKTLCFVVPMLDMFLTAVNSPSENGRMAVFAVIILPTRELATQVHSVVVDATDYLTSCTGCTSENSKGLFSCLVLIGGCSVDHDVKTITELNRGGSRPFVIATPGRLRHLMDALQHEMLWTFKEVAMLVLDEADRLLEMGYQTDMTAIMGNMPKQRKTGFFSATLPTAVLEFAKRILKNYHFINADEQGGSSSPGAKGSDEETAWDGSQPSDSVAAYATPRSLKNFYIVMDPREKLHFVVMLLQRLRETGVRKCAIFFLTCDLVDYFSAIFPELLKSNGSEDADGSKTIFYKIHRKMPTPKRQQNLNRFRGPPDGKSKAKTDGAENIVGTCVNGTILQVMLCTDVFSRGIDIPEIEWVIQYDAPQDPNFYVHRIGRVSRAGAAGNALLLLNKSEEAYVQFQINRKIPLSALPNDIVEGVLGYFQKPADQKPVLPHESHSACTTVSNGMPYLEYLEQTSPESPVLPWRQTCKLLSYIRSYLSTERAVLLMATRAFVSYTRAYSEHRLKSIFEQRNLDYGGLATSFGVLKVPRVKEILGKKLNNFANSDIDVDSVPFRDEKREAERLRKLQQSKTETREKHILKKPEPRPKVQRTRSEKRNAKRENMWKDWDELAREEALAKKLRKRKITQEEYERLLSRQERSESGESDDESGDSEGTSSEPEKQEDDSDWETVRLVFKILHFHQQLDDFVKEWAQNYAEYSLHCFCESCLVAPFPKRVLGTLLGSDLGVGECDGQAAHAQRGYIHVAVPDEATRRQVPAVVRHEYADSVGLVEVARQQQVAALPRLAADIEAAADWRQKFADCFRIGSVDQMLGEVIAVQQFALRAVDDGAVEVHAGVPQNVLALEWHAPSTEEERFAHFEYFEEGSAVPRQCLSVAGHEGAVDVDCKEVRG
ncbi:ATP-dependent RNA helicase [Babesia caballi]|uniref:ATP-dependent RNA helicase n=1 Tax=Babesia caballi TaxID=5871 RepID=A0AAV4LMZ9_BABCB|nr:ATP-dependent RNA helicase [Babesia caballi]